ncbi:MAG: CoA ester lyase [Sphingomonadaceae bacterium]
MKAISRKGLAMHLNRSLLYLPAANARAIEKARTADADIVILDLEDAVAPAAKEEARKAATDAVNNGDWGGRRLAIRVNGFGTSWSDADFAAAAGSRVELLIVPKVNTVEDAATAVAKAGGKPVWAMIETPQAVQAVDGIAAVPGITGLVAGFNDLAKDLRITPTPDRMALIYSASRMIVAARAAGIAVFDGVFGDFRNPEGLAIETAQGRAFGFDGKTCIHPDQLATVNRLFTPSDRQIEEAEGLVAVWTEAERAGQGIATYKGRMVESMHATAAREVLALADAIRQRV